MFGAVGADLTKLLHEFVIDYRCHGVSRTAVHYAVPYGRDRSEETRLVEPGDQRVGGTAMVLGID